MSFPQNATSTSKALDRYEQFLHTIPEQEFQINPAEGVWSYSEVYSHILSANHACLIAMQHCVQGKGIESTEKATLFGRLVLFFGFFPPIKIKAPERIAAMVKKISKAEAFDQLKKFRENLEALLPQVEQSSATQKAKHPRLGLFTAQQWLRFILIHTRHHEKQLYRIKASFEKA